MTTTDTIDRVVLTHLSVPFKKPFRTAFGELTMKDAVLIEVETSSGVGLGEASPIMPTRLGPSITVDACWDALAGAVAPALLGRTVRAPDDIAEMASAWRVNPYAAAGAETALWDLLGQARHASVAELLGATDLRIDMGVEAGLAIAPTSSIVELLQTIESHLEAGYRRVKINIQPGQDLEVVRAVRQHIGDVPLMVDGKGTYSAADLDVFRELDDYDLLMYEQPMPADDLNGLAALQQAVATPVCLDETANDLERVAEAIRRGAGRIVNLKLQRLGGLGPSRALHDFCYQNGVACWVGAMPELGVGQAHAIHLATLPNCKYPADIEPSARWFVDDYTVPLVELAKPGIIEVPTRPGLGYHVDSAKVRRYQVRREEITRRSSA